MAVCLLIVGVFDVRESFIGQTLAHVVEVKTEFSAGQ
jgi:hypothetical protein